MTEPDPSTGPVDLADIAEAARGTLPAPVWDFIEGGSGAEITLAANAAAFAGLQVVPRVLRDVSVPDTACTLLGTDLSMPVVIAPMAYHRLLHADAEAATAEAARGEGVGFAVSTMSSMSLEDVAAVGARLWFQLYWLKDRALVADLVARAETAGYRAVMVTVDVPRMGRRLRDVRNRFSLPSHVVAANIDGGRPGMAHVPPAHGNAVAAHTNAVFEAALTWDDIAWLRENTSLPVLIKGVLDPDDAVRAVELGVEGIVVSNHGGRQFDGAVPSLRVLPAIRDAVGTRCRLLLDSGVRGGADMIKAIASGADAVMIGRPVLWGLAARGEEGVREVLQTLRAELTDGMALAGCPDLGSVRRLKTFTASSTSTIW